MNISKKNIKQKSNKFIDIESKLPGAYIIDTDVNNDKIKYDDDINKLQ